MNVIEHINEQFAQLQARDGGSNLQDIRRQAFTDYSKWGIPTVKHEEWKYTRVSGLLTKEYQFPLDLTAAPVTESDLEALRLPGHEQANELFFVNGLYAPSLSKILSKQLVVQPLEEAAANEHKETVLNYFGDSRQYLKDGINALNTAFVNGAVFIQVKKRQVLEHPLYIYNITDARSGNVFSQPRSLVHIGEQAQAQLVETFVAIGSSESFTNQVMEVVVEKEALLEYYKIQQEGSTTNQVSTTHIRQIGKSYTHTVTISLNGGLVRNNLNLVLDAEYCEAHLYGLYFPNGTGHVDNHTVVDNVKPNCFSNELYKGIIDDTATAVFNGKIFVRQQAQKTNAYQSNKNILLSDGASVNTKPQLEIFADDVKCSHGCTVGQLDEEALFYLRSRGVGEKSAKSLLLHAFADDILQTIKLNPLRTYVEQLISERLDFDVV